MGSRLAPLLAAASVLGLLVWLMATRHLPVDGGTPPPEAGPAAPRELPLLLPVGPAGGSAVPCAVPMRWRIAAVDPRLSLTPSEARAATAEAIALWERATGRSLFLLDSLEVSSDASEAYPIRFVRDEGQAGPEELRRIEAEYGAAEGELVAWQRELEARVEALSAEQAGHRETADAFGRRLDRHNETVLRWRERGGAPAEVIPELRGTERELERERLRLEEERLRLEALREELMADDAHLRVLVERHQARGDSLRRAYPLSRMEAGVYREGMQAGEGGGSALSREIRIHRFEGRNDLVRVLAHELGHALGLPHLSAAEALMAPEYGRATLAQAPTIHDSERDLLAALCRGR